jgi:hypothetical protein
VKNNRLGGGGGSQMRTGLVGLLFQIGDKFAAKSAFCAIFQQKQATFPEKI